MLDGLRRYVWNRRRGIATAAGIIGGIYVVSKYVIERLEEMRAKFMQEKLAKENLKRRFLQNQQDCTFTILALIPTMGSRILEEMDVEALTEALQDRTKLKMTESSREHSVSSSRSLRTTEIPSINPPTLPTLLPENDGRDVDSRSSAASVSGDEAASGRLGESSLSWVEQFTTSSASNGHGSPSSSAGAQLSDSMISGSVSNVSEADVPSESSSVSRHRNQTKAELWKEIKILSFTRSLTILYSISLLSLLTHVQLNLIGRTKYVESIIQLEKRERFESEFSIGSLIWGNIGGNVFGRDTESTLEVQEMNEETERKYLVLSWWLTHVSWRSLGERVRKVVEQVLESVSLKARLNAHDISLLVKRIRHGIEFGEVEGQESHLSFSDILLPPNARFIDQTLLSSGIPPHLLPSISLDLQFEKLLDESRRFINSPDFDQVLRSTFNCASEVLLRYIDKEIFQEVPSSSSVDKLILRLAEALPGIARWGHLTVHGLPNELVENVSNLKEVTGFSAVIYSSYEENMLS